MGMKLGTSEIVNIIFFILLIYYTYWMQDQMLVKKKRVWFSLPIVLGSKLVARMIAWISMFGDSSSLAFLFAFDTICNLIFVISYTIAVAYVFMISVKAESIIKIFKEAGKVPFILSIVIFCLAEINNYIEIVSLQMQLYYFSNALKSENSSFFDLIYSLTNSPYSKVPLFLFAILPWIPALIYGIYFMCMRTNYTVPIMDENDGRSK